MTLEEVMTELESYGSDQCKKIYTNHGCPEPFFGVKVADLKVILKKTKKNQALAEELFATGNSDAMYLAGLMAEEKKISKATLEQWVQGATWYMISEFTVPWITAEAGFGLELGLEWIENENDLIKAAGWSAISGYLALTQNEEIDYDLVRKLLTRVATSLQSETNRTKYAMNGFVIQVGAQIPDLYAEAIATAEKVGKVEVNLGKTSCKVPDAIPYMENIVNKGRQGKKKKKVRC